MNDLVNKIRGMVNGARFASFLYTAKGTGETARFNVLLGFSYVNAVEKSLRQIRATLPHLTGLELQAATELRDSFVETIEKHAKGEQNSAYTKKGQYSPLGNGLNVNDTDGSLQLFAFIIKKTVISPGVYKAVKSAPLTIAKNKLRKRLVVSRVREFALDSGVAHVAKLEGNTLVLG